MRVLSYFIHTARAPNSAAFSFVGALCTIFRFVGALCAVFRFGGPCVPYLGLGGPVYHI